MKISTFSLAAIAAAVSFSFVSSEEVAEEHRKTQGRPDDIFTPPLRELPNPKAQRVFDFWTPQKIAEAIPRDFVYNGDPDDRLLRQRQLQTVTDGSWEDPSSLVTNAAGRILFEMSGTTYVCSGTAVQDGVSGRSVILTAAHCVYDDANKAFATNVMFIPKQDDGGTDGTDSDCSNDPFGCWAPDLGVVDDCWSSRTWPSNIECDYGYYVVDDSGAHTGPAGVSDALDVAVAPLPVDFTSNAIPTCASGLGSLMGYSYDEDPDFRYCVRDLEAGSDGWEFPRCKLSGGSSGGPGMFWCNPGNGPLVTVVSWGSTRGQARMGGPYLFGNLAECCFGLANTTALADGDIIVESDGSGGCSVKTGGGGGGGGLSCVSSSPSCLSSCPAGGPVGEGSASAGDCCQCGRYRGCQGPPRSLCNGIWQ